jgi:hypothetical protein
LGQHRYELGAEKCFREKNMMTLLSKPVRKEIIDESRAAYLLGLPPEQMRQICEMSGIGRLEAGETDGRLVFTYEELHKLCRLVVGPAS